MAITPLPPYIPTFESIPNVTPFTYRDGLSYVQKFERLVKYLNRVILPYINEHFTELYDEFERQVNLMITTVNEQLAAQDASVDAKITELETYVNEQVQIIINDSVVVQDPVMAGIMGDAGSDTRTVTDLLYADASYETIIDTGRLSEEELDTRYGGAIATPDASETVKGKIEIATAAEALAGVDTVRAITPATMAMAINAIPPSGGNGALDLSDYDDLKSAIAALPATGGTINVPVGRFYVGDWPENVYMNKPNVKIVGLQTPRVSANADRLENGSILYGRFNVFADGFEVDRVGFDMGKYTVDTHFGALDTHSANYPHGGTWDGLIFAAPQSPIPVPRVGVRIGSIISLLRDSQSVGHAVLLENIKDSKIGEITGIGGNHAVAIKAQNTDIGAVYGYASSSNCVVFKADSYAPCGNVRVGRVVSAKNIPGASAPWFVIATTAAGLHINPATSSTNGPITIGDITIVGVNDAFVISGGATYSANDIQIGNLYVDGSSVTTNGIAASGCKALRLSIANLNVKNVTQGVFWGTAVGAGDASDIQLYIGHAVFDTISNLVLHMPYYGRVKIDSIEIDTALNAYKVFPTAKLFVGSEALIGVTNKWESGGPTLANGWVNYGSGNPAFDVILENYGVRITGLIKAGTSSGNGVWMSVPEFLRPSAILRFPVATGITAELRYGQVIIGTDGGADINNGAAVGVGNYFSLDGIFWKLPVS